MRQIRRVLLIWVFLMSLFFVVVGQARSTVWARAEQGLPASVPQRTELAQQDETETPDEASPNDLLATTPEMRVAAIPFAYHDELAVSQGISLTYKTKGLGDPIENQLVIQSKAGNGSVVQIGPEKWVHSASKTYDLTPGFFPGAVAVTNISSLQPISWTGKSGIWAVNATNTGVNLIVAAKQSITTELSVGTPFTDVVASTSTFTYTMRSSGKIGAQWGHVYATLLAVYNGCSGASWVQNLSSKDKFVLSGATGSVTSYGPAPWDMRHVDGSGVIVASGTIVSPICGNAQNPPPVGTFTPIFLYLPTILR